MGPDGPSRWLEMYVYSANLYIYSPEPDAAIVKDLILAACDVEGNFLVVKVSWLVCVFCLCKLKNTTF